MAVFDCSVVEDMEMILTKRQRRRSKWAFRIRLGVGAGLLCMYLAGIAMPLSDIQAVAFHSVTAGTCLIVAMMVKIPIPHHMQGMNQAKKLGFAGAPVLSHRWAVLELVPILAGGLIFTALIARSLDTQAAAKGHG